MQLHRKTSLSKNDWVLKTLIKVLIVILLLIGSAFLIEKIDFPTPTKKIEKIISNENFKVVK